MKKLALFVCACFLVASCGKTSSQNEGNSSESSKVKTESTEVKKEYTPLTQGQVNVLDYLLDNDAEGFANGQESMVNYVAIANPYSSVEIAKDYGENEIAADEKYLNKSVIVEGEIKSINKAAITDNPYVNLPGVNRFMDVQAHFDNSMAKVVGGFKKGTKARFVCSVEGFSFGTVLLKNCELLADVVALEKEKIKKGVTELAETGSTTNGIDVSSEIFGMVTIINLNADGQCNESAEACGKWFTTFMAANAGFSDESKKKYEEVMKHYELKSMFDLPSEAASGVASEATEKSEK